MHESPSVARGIPSPGRGAGPPAFAAGAPVSNPEETEEIHQARRRYDEMCRRLDGLADDEDRPGALESDYEALVDSAGRWMARQDAGRR